MPFLVNDMANLFSVDNPINRGLTKIGELIILSILWFVTSLPILTIGTSTAALYYAVVKSIRRGRGYPVKEYFKAWKQNFVKGSVLTLILAAFLLFLLYWLDGLRVTIVDITELGVQSAFAGKSESLVMMYTVCSIVLILEGVLFNYLFPVLSRLEISVAKIVILSIVMAVRYFYYSIALVVILYALGLFTYIMPLAIIFTPGLWALLSSFLIEKAMKKYLPPPQEGEDAWWTEL